MRVLLTGAAGFIGLRVDAALRAAGHDVVAVDARTSSLKSSMFLSNWANTSKAFTPSPL